MRVLLASLLGVLMATTQVSAENPRREKFRKLDKNHDGRLTQDEFSGHPGNFRAMDCDDDRLVTEAEFVNPYHCDEKTTKAADAFADADANRDGVLTRGEWRGAYDDFSRFDRNNDGRVTRDEYSRPLDPNSPEGRFQAKDQNNDGVLARNEWRDEGLSFQDADANGDGVVTLREYLDQPRAESYPDESFADLDHNHDGRLSRDEWHADSASFARADRNRDGVIERSEFSLPGRAVGRDARFRSLDRNGDGVIEWSEWDGDDEAFRLLDANRDDVVSRWEFRTTRVLSRRFSELDYDRTGDLSQDEWPGDQSRFARLDRNHDGFVSLEEYLYNQ